MNQKHSNSATRRSTGNLSSARPKSGRRSPIRPRSSHGASAQAEKFGQGIAKMRERDGLSLCALARAASVSHASLSRIEYGRSLPQARTLLAILSALGAGRRVITDVKAIGRRIGQLRRLHLLSGPEFAQVIGNSRLSAHRVYDWELGRIVPGMAALVRICAAFRIGLEFFFGPIVRLT